MIEIQPWMERLADCLATARRMARQVAPLPSDLIPTSADEGYAVNQLIAARLGWEPLGWKIAATTQAMQQKLRSSVPIYGRTWRRFACPSPARFHTPELLDPLVECECFVTLDKDLPARDTAWTMADIVDSVATVHAGIEVAECRFPMAELPQLPAILADGSASGRYVFGDEIRNWRLGLADMVVVLEVDGTPRRRGCGADVMGNPLAPLLWLANERRRWGDGLKAGETVSTGSMTGMLPIRAGQHVLARFGDGRQVEISFDS